MVKEHREVRFLFSGDVSAAKLYAQKSRVFLGDLKESMELNSLLQAERKVTFYDGTVFELKSAFGLDEIRIIVPPNAAPPPPPTKEVSEKEEEIEEEELEPPIKRTPMYFPYLWVGARIISGGQTDDGTGDIYDSTGGVEVFEPDWNEEGAKAGSIGIGTGWGYSVANGNLSQPPWFWIPEDNRMRPLREDGSFDAVVDAYARHPLTGSPIFEPDVLCTSNGMYTAMSSADDPDPDSDELWSCTVTLDPEDKPKTIVSPGRVYVPSGGSSMYNFQIYEGWEVGSFASGEFELKGTVRSGDYHIKATASNVYLCDPPISPITVELEIRLGQEPYRLIRREERTFWGGFLALRDGNPWGWEPEAEGFNEDGQYVFGPNPHDARHWDTGAIVVNVAEGYYYLDDVNSGDRSINPTAYSTTEHYAPEPFDEGSGDTGIPVFCGEDHRP